LPVAGAQEAEAQAPRHKRGCNGTGGAEMSTLSETPRRIDWARLTEARSIGIFGIFLGCLAAWLALPPLHVRSPFVPIGVGLLGIFAGVWAVTRKGGKPAWGAIVIGILGIAL